MSYLEIKDLYKNFDNTQVLKGLNLNINKNEITCIIGSSGNGKTTLLRCLADLETPTSGEINIDGVNFFPNKDNKINIGFVFQSFNLFPQYTALDNVLLALNINLKRKDKEQKEKNREKAIAILNDMGLGDKLDFYPYQLSGGQKQRVAIARALALEPSILLFDEPTSALDPKITKNVAALLKKLKKEYTIIVVTHDMDFCKSIADKVFFLNEGIIEAEGTVDDIYNSNNQKVIEFLEIERNSEDGQEI